MDDKIFNSTTNRPATWLRLASDTLWNLPLGCYSFHCFLLVTSVYPTLDLNQNFVPSEDTASAIGLVGHTPDEIWTRMPTLFSAASLAQCVFHSTTGAYTPGGIRTLMLARQSLNLLCLPISPRVLAYIFVDNRYSRNRIFFSLIYNIYFHFSESNGNNELTRFAYCHCTKVDAHFLNRTEIWGLQGPCSTIELNGRSY